MRLLFLLLFAPVILVGCENQKEDYDTSNPVLVKAYSDSYLFPDGFYFESIDSGSLYYVNTLSIKPPDLREISCIQLCTNDINEARTWTEQTNINSSVYRNPVSERQTEKYFEFKRVSPINKRDIVLFRVHRKDYFKPLKDSYKLTDTIGQIPIAALETTDKEQLLEYLWSIGSIEPFDKVLESYSQDTINGFKQVIVSMAIVYGDFGLNDQIKLYENVLLIDTSDGIIRLRKRLLEEIKGKMR